MKKLLSILTTLPLTLAACTNSNTQTPPTNGDSQGQDNTQDGNNNNGDNTDGDSTNTPDREPNVDVPDGGNPNDTAHTIKGVDSISNMGKKAYTNKDMAVINNTWNSTFTFMTGDAYSDEHGNAIDETSCPLVRNTQALTRDSPLTATTQDASDPTADWTVYAPETQYAVRGTSWVIDENDTHFFLATNSHVATNVGWLSGIGNHSYLSKCVFMKSNDSRNITMYPDYDWDWENKSLIEDIASETSVLDSWENLKGAIFIGTNIDVNDGRGNSKKGMLDLTILPVKKSDVRDNTGKVYDIAPLMFAAVAPDDPSFNKARSVYTTGYPKGFKRYNKALGSSVSGYTLADAYNGYNVSYDIGSRNYNNQLVNVDMWQTGGSSGSPVVDADGKLIGINTFLITNSSGIKSSEMISVKQIKEVYRDFICPKAKAKGINMNKCS